MRSWSPQRSRGGRRREELEIVWIGGPSGRDEGTGFLRALWTGRVFFFRADVRVFAKLFFLRKSDEFEGRVVANDLCIRIRERVGFL